MGFENNMGFIRKLGRKIVLPSDAIQRNLERLLFFYGKGKVHTIIDIGAGTLYWSEWLAQYADTVYAVDLIYPDGEQKRESARGGGAVIICSNDIGKVLKENDNKNTLVWMCDVLHHMPELLAHDILRTCLEKYNYVVVKDIDCRNRFGNFMNRMHDRVINKEKIRDIDPVHLEELMVKKRFKVKLYGMKRLWYPHFLLIAVRE